MLLWLFLACTNQTTESNSSTAAEAITQPIPAERPRVIILGDSLTAGLGISAELSYPSLLQDEFMLRGQPIELINAGVSGDTTAGGLRRLDWLLKQDPDLLVIELGANDGMRGVPIENIESNLATMIERTQEQQVDVLLIGMQIPTNYGQEYTQNFKELYPILANKYQIEMVPFLLEGVAGQRDLNQADGIHPTAEGHRIIADTVLPFLQQWRASWAPKKQDQAL